MSIGENIKKLRKKNKMMQSELAQALNISHATVSSWEVGRTEPKMTMIEQLCEIFECEKSELIDGQVASSDKRVLDIAVKISELSPEQRQSVLHYIDFLREKGGET